MADIAFTGWGRYYQTGTIDINAAPPLLPDTAQILFPPISGRRTSTRTSIGITSRLFRQPRERRDRPPSDGHAAACAVRHRQHHYHWFGPAELRVEPARRQDLASRVTCEGSPRPRRADDVRYHLHPARPRSMLIGLMISAILLTA